MGIPERPFALNKIKYINLKREVTMKVCRSRQFSFPLLAAVTMALAFNSAVFCGDIDDAVSNGDLATVRALLKDNPNLISSRAYGLTPLHTAATACRSRLGPPFDDPRKAKAVAELLLEKGADVNARGGDRGWTPLDMAATSGCTEVAELLLAHGAEVNAKDSGGRTALHEAAAYGYKDVAQLLLVHGAEVDAKDNRGLTPLHYATKYSHKEVAELLLANKADALAAHGPEYRSGKGFRLDYPDDWQVATEKKKGELSEATSDFLRNIDFSRMDFIAFDPSSHPTQSVNVIVFPRPTPINKEQLSKVESALRDEIDSAGLAASGFESKLVHTGDNDVIWSSWSATPRPPRGEIVTLPFSSGPEPIRQEQALVSGKNHTYVVTCSACNRAEFASIMGSFQVVNEPGMTFQDWWAGVPTGVVIGAGVGLAFGLFLALFRRLSKA
ncbi:MAG: ankyrin repeat domain-containing protein [Terriglobia bacterium]